MQIFNVQIGQTDTETMRTKSHQGNPGEKRQPAFHRVDSVAIGSPIVGGKYYFGNYICCQPW